MAIEPEWRRVSISSVWREEPGCQLPWKLALDDDEFNRYLRQKIGEWYEGSPGRRSRPSSPSPSNRGSGSPSTGSRPLSSCTSCRPAGSFDGLGTAWRDQMPPPSSPRPGSRSTTSMRNEHIDAGSSVRDNAHCRRTRVILPAPSNHVGEQQREVTFIAIRRRTGPGHHPPLPALPPHDVAEAAAACP